MMFDWRDFFGALIFFSALILIVCFIACGFYIICEMGSAWGFALIVGAVVLGGSIAIGYGL